MGTARSLRRQMTGKNRFVSAIKQDDNIETSTQRAMKRAKAGGYFRIISAGIGLLFVAIIYYELPYAMAIVKALLEQ